MNENIGFFAQKLSLDLASIWMCSSEEVEEDGLVLSIYDYCVKGFYLM